MPVPLCSNGPIMAVLTPDPATCWPTLVYAKQLEIERTGPCLRGFTLSPEFGCGTTLPESEHPPSNQWSGSPADRLCGGFRRRADWTQDCGWCTGRDVCETMHQLATNDPAPPHKGIGYEGSESKQRCRPIPSRQVWFLPRVPAGASGHLSRLSRTHAVFGAAHKLRAELTLPIPVEPFPYR